MLRSRTSLSSHTQRILLGLMVVLLTGCPKLSTKKPIPPAQATQTKKQKKEKEKKKETERLEKEEAKKLREKAEALRKEFKGIIQQERSSLEAVGNTLKGLSFSAIIQKKSQLKLAVRECGAWLKCMECYFTIEVLKGIEKSLQKLVAFYEGGQKEQVFKNLQLACADIIEIVNKERKLEDSQALRLVQEAKETYKQIRPSFGTNTTSGAATVPHIFQQLIDVHKSAEAGKVQKAAEPLKEERGNYPEMKKEIKTILCKLLPVEIIIFRVAHLEASNILQRGQGDQSTLKKLANVKIILQYLEEFQEMVTADDQNIAYLIEAKYNFEAIKNYTKAENPEAADATLIKRIAPAAHEKIIAMLNCLIKVEEGGNIEQFKKALLYAQEADKAYDDSFQKKK